MRRLRLLLEYDGTDFDGFQKQPERSTVQGVLEDKLSQVCGHLVAVTGAGRTDAGVHALGQVAHFDSTSRIPADRVPRAVNSLPGSGLVVRHAEETMPDFHARFGAARRTYRYYASGDLPSPFLERYVTYAPGLRPDAAERIRIGLAPLVGRHDFVTFCDADAASKGTVRNLLRAEVRERGALLAIELTADAFLRSMARTIVGMALDIGKGRSEPETLVESLAARDRAAAAMTAPANGLFLMRVDYPDGYPEGRPLSEAPWWEDSPSPMGERESG